MLNDGQLRLEINSAAQKILSLTLENNRLRRMILAIEQAATMEGVKELIDVHRQMEQFIGRAA